MSSSSTELIAEYAAILPMWLNTLDIVEREQQQLLDEMQADGVVIEEEPSIAAGAEVAKAQSETAATEIALEAAEEEIDPISWLAPSDNKPPTDGAAPPDMLGFDLPDMDQSRATMPQVAMSHGVSADEAEPAESVWNVVPQNVVLDDSTLSAGPRGNEETNLFTARGDDPSVATLFEQNFGETHTDFLHALREVDEEALPWDLRETMRYATTQEEVAAAFVKVQRDGQLEEFVHLDEAVREMGELDYHFRDANERYDTAETGDDPILPLF